MKNLAWTGTSVTEWYAERRKATRSDEAGSAIRQEPLKPRDLASEGSRLVPFSIPPASMT